MRIFDETAICRQGMSLRDLVVFTSLYVSIKAIFMAITNFLFPSWPVPYHITSKYTMVNLAAEFIAIPVLGLLAGKVVHGRFRVLVQVLVIFFFHSIIADFVACFIM